MNREEGLNGTKAKRIQGNGVLEKGLNY